MFRIVAILICFAAMVNEGVAQRSFVTGYVRDSITLFPIGDATISNINTKKTVKTNDSGFFRLEANPNDHIYASAGYYSPDTLIYSYLFADTITILLSPSGNILPNVLVTAKYTKYQLDSIQRKQDFDELRGIPYKLVAPQTSFAFGLTINLDRVLKKKYRAMKGEERIFNATEKLAYVDYRYSPHIVAYYTGLKGDQLKAFMRAYTPTYAWLRAHPTNEDVMYFINDSLKQYRSKNK